VLGVAADDLRGTSAITVCLMAGVSGASRGTKRTRNTWVAMREKNASISRSVLSIDGSAALAPRTSAHPCLNRLMALVMLRRRIWMSRLAIFPPARRLKQHQS